MSRVLTDKTLSDLQRLLDVTLKFIIYPFSHKYIIIYDVANAITLKYIHVETKFLKREFFLFIFF